MNSCIIFIFLKVINGCVTYIFLKVINGCVIYSYIFLEAINKKKVKETRKNMLLQTFAALAKFTTYKSFLKYKRRVYLFSIRFNY
jgi:hypothetical protein